MDRRVTGMGVPLPEAQAGKEALLTAPCPGPAPGWGWGSPSQLFLVPGSASCPKPFTLSPHSPSGGHGPRTQAPEVKQDRLCVQTLSVDRQQPDRTDYPVFKVRS